MILFKIKYLEIIWNKMFDFSGWDLKIFPGFCFWLQNSRTAASDSIINIVFPISQAPYSAIEGIAAVASSSSNCSGKLVCEIVGEVIRSHNHFKSQLNKRTHESLIKQYQHSYYTNVNSDSLWHRIWIEIFPRFIWKWNLF